MKHLYLVKIFIFMACSAFAQQYKSFPASGAVWRETYSASECCPVTFINKDYHLKQEKDTVINSLTYHLLTYKQWHTSQQQGRQQPDFRQFSQGIFGAIREDDNKHIFAYDFKAQKDTLLYDFNLALGDTLPITLINGDFINRVNLVASVDSVLLGNQYHKRFGIAASSNTANPYVYLIEGMGSTFGLFSILIPPFEQGTNLNCFSVNNTSLYKANELSDCNLVTSVNNELKKPAPQLIIYPNPTTGQFTIQTQSIFGDSYICIRDVLGKVVLQEKFYDSNLEINISNQPKGLYFVEIDYIGRRIVQKLILE